MPGAVTAKVVEAANEFLATLSAAERTKGTFLVATITVSE